MPLWAARRRRNPRADPVRYGTASEPPRPPVTERAALISHRFSTVRMAGLIAVLDRGLCAELFTLQARAYGGR